eukprot:746875-Hanusia_phi.AAC.4
MPRPRRCLEVSDLGPRLSFCSSVRMTLQQREGQETKSEAIKGIKDKGGRTGHGAEEEEEERRRRRRRRRRHLRFAMARGLGGCRAEEASSRRRQACSSRCR